MTLRSNALLQTIRNFWFPLTFSDPSSLRGRGPTNELSIIQIIQNFLLVGIVTTPILIPYSPWNSSSLRPSDCCLRVSWRICLRFGEKYWKCCGDITFCQHPSLKCFAQEGRSGNRWHGIKVNTIYRGQEYLDSDVFTTLQLVTRFFVLRTFFLTCPLFNHNLEQRLEHSLFAKIGSSSS